MLRNYLVYPTLAFNSKLDNLNKKIPYHRNLKKIEKDYEEIIKKSLPGIRREGEYNNSIFKILDSSLFANANVSLDNWTQSSLNSWYALTKKEGQIYRNYKDYIIERTLNGDFSILTKADIEYLLRVFSTQVYLNIESEFSAYKKEIVSYIRDYLVQLDSLFTEYKVNEKETANNIGEIVQNIKEFSNKLINHIDVDYENLQPGFFVYETYLTLKEKVNSKPLRDGKFDFKNINDVMFIEFMYLLSLFFKDNSFSQKLKGLLEPFYEDARCFRTQYNNFIEKLSIEDNKKLLYFGYSTDINSEEVEIEEEIKDEN